MFAEPSAHPAVSSFRSWRLHVNDTHHRLACHWREYRSLALFLFLMLGFRSAWADWMVVPSGSMNPTILEGDRILVDKHAFGVRIPWTLSRLTSGADPVRGDIVVFDSPADGTTLVKRVIAVPGDSVELDGEQLVVNGTPAHYESGDSGIVRQLLQQTRQQTPEVLRESGVGRTHDMLLLPLRQSTSAVGPIRIPPDAYFVLGDNRDNSADSRFIGLVPRRSIVGRASRVVVSLDPDRYWLPRVDRTWHLLM
jgi:signal peptidase I